MFPLDPHLAPTDRRPTPDEGHALVHHGSRRWVLEPGQSVSFGRGSPCDIRIAHDPLDDHVSRRAGVVEHQGEHLVVRNESATRCLILSPARGDGRVIRPGEAVACTPEGEFLVALDGRGGSHYVLQVTGPGVCRPASLGADT
jgi:hypothetical protein